MLQRNSGAAVCGISTIGTQAATKVEIFLIFAILVEISAEVLNALIRLTADCLKNSNQLNDLLSVVRTGMAEFKGDLLCRHTAEALE